MGLALLPWEKLPGWLIGPTMVYIGSYLVGQYDLYSWRAVEGILFIPIGIAVFCVSVHNFFISGPAEADTVEEGSRQPPSQQVTDPAEPRSVLAQ